MGIEPTQPAWKAGALPLSYTRIIWSGRRDSNPRLRPWQGRTLPLSHSRSKAWCGRRDLNSHAMKALDPKSSASANSATPADCTKNGLVFRHFGILTPSISLVNMLFQKPKHGKIISTAFMRRSTFCIFSRFHRDKARSGQSLSKPPVYPDATVRESLYVFLRGKCHPTPAKYTATSPLLQACYNTIFRNQSLVILLYFPLICPNHIH